MKLFLKPSGLALPTKMEGKAKPRTSEELFWTLGTRQEREGGRWSGNEGLLNTQWVPKNTETLPGQQTLTDTTSWGHGRVDQGGCDQAERGPVRAHPLVPTVREECLSQRKDAGKYPRVKGPHSIKDKRCRYPNQSSSFSWTWAVLS